MNAIWLEEYGLLSNVFDVRRNHKSVFELVRLVLSKINSIDERVIDLEWREFTDTLFANYGQENAKDPDLFCIECLDMLMNTFCFREHTSFISCIKWLEIIPVGDKRLKLVHIEFCEEAMPHVMLLKLQLDWEYHRKVLKETEIPYGS
ncbi:hypothetical protein P0E66_13815 [Enterococcus faecalis]|uniref:hypothetical protein n=1 Tax=Enterococcus faecalis TaxID=1351 RepID=UPI0025B0067D|nr:hypothetical protein [Enterococcus faecalis]MDN3202203.1 hypothetical protein [Enterococcus faecalis]